MLIPMVVDSGMGRHLGGGGGISVMDGVRLGFTGDASSARVSE